MAGYLYAEQKYAAHIYAQCRGCKSSKGLIGGENTHENIREQHYCSPQQNGVGKAGLQQQEEGVFYTCFIACAIIVAENGLGALGDARHGKHGKLHNACKYGHGSYCDIPAVAKEGGIEAYGYYAFTGLHYECGGAQSDTGHNNIPMQAHVLSFKLKKGFSSQ